MKHACSISLILLAGIPFYQCTQVSSNRDEELSLASSLDASNRVYLEVINQHTCEVPLKDICLCIESNDAYQEKIVKKKGKYIGGFIVCNVQDKKGNIVFNHHPPIPDRVKVSHRFVFQESGYRIPPNQKIRILITDDLGDKNNSFWSRTTIKFRICYQNKSYFTQVTFP